MRQVAEDDVERPPEAIDAVKRFDGVVSYLNVVVVQTAQLNNERTAVNILGRRLVAAATLVKALGGGWDASRLAQE